MRGSEYSSLKAFAAIAQHRSFSGAAKDIGVSASALSQIIRDLEKRLGVRLFNRTTRSVTLTDAGGQLLDRILPLFEEFDAALEDIGSLRDKPSGTLRICAQHMAISYLIQPILPRFQELYPDIVLELISDEAIDDIFARGFDAGIRLGEFIEKDMIAIRIGPDLRQVAVATPDYLRKHGMPQSPSDLQYHCCITWKQPGRETLYNWEFAKDGKWFEVAVKGSLMVNDSGVALRAARDGMGITLWMEEWVQDDVQSGKLVPLLQNWSPPFPGFYLFHPSRRQVPANLRAFIDVLKTATNLPQHGVQLEDVVYRANA
jgi:DNA-binding transcriptional LysR family regulator